MKLKAKLMVGIGFLFIVILVFGILGIVSINRLSNDADNILKNNYETLVYDNNMLKDLDDLAADKLAFTDFEANLIKQENNITEFGEGDATKQLRDGFEGFKKKPNDSSSYRQMRQAIQQINTLNQNAILRKHETAKKTASSAIFWLTIIFSVLTIISFTLTINFPDVISTPIKALAVGIKEIANKNYNNRINLDKEDEFKELADAINTMADKLDEYEHSMHKLMKEDVKRLRSDALVIDIIENKHSHGVTLNDIRMVMVKTMMPSLVRPGDSSKTIFENTRRQGWREREEHQICHMSPEVNRMVYLEMKRALDLGIWDPVVPEYCVHPHPWEHYFYRL